MMQQLVHKSDFIAFAPEPRPGDRLHCFGQLYADTSDPWLAWFRMMAAEKDRGYWRVRR